VSALHPYTQLALAALLPALAWLAPGAPAPALALAASVGLVLAAPRPLGRLAAAAAAAAPFWLFLFLLHPPARAGVLAMRLTTLLVAAGWLGAVLAPGRLIEALVARGWSARVAYLLGGTIAAVPLVRAHARRISEAQRCRGLATRGGIRPRLRAVHALVLPLVLSVLHQLDERVLALETRGLGGATRRTPLDPPADSSVQTAIRWGAAAACLGALAARMAWHS
jgi:energy-coupling factor transporter transmembrane protein EcfT